MVAVNYSYNAANRLIRVEDELSGLIIADYGYDPFGRRLWKDVGGTRTYFFYSDEGLIAEYDASGNEIRSYDYEPDSTWGTNPLWLKQDGEYYFYHNDHLGTPQKLVATNGKVVWSAQYTAFGEAQIQVETITNNLRFPGQYYDAETGLHYNWNRYYDPVTGRYTQVDPIGFAGGDVNWYAYVWNQPLQFGDSSGLAMYIGVKDENGALRPLTSEDIAARNQWLRTYLDVLPELILDWFLPVNPTDVAVDVQLAIFDLVCPLTIVPLKPSLLGVADDVLVDGTLTLLDDVLTIKVDFIYGKIKNPFQIVEHLVDMARKLGVSTLRIEAEVINEKLFKILQKRYGLSGVFEGAGFIEILVK